MEGQKKVEKHPAEELLSRFRLKEDLYRYMTQQGKQLMIHTLMFYAVNIFFPSMRGTKISFMRDILSEQNSHLK